MDRIFPRNLTARAAVQIAGNPVSSRLESGVSNCFPGLEFDHRNLDRRFFPGLVFEFVSSTARRQGIRLVSVDANDPDLDADTFTNRPADKPDAQAQQALAAQLRGNTGKKTLSQGAWFVESLTQAGKTIVLHANAQGQPPLDGMTSWRLVRSLQPGPLTIKLARRPDSANGNVPPPATLELTGWRRAYVDSNAGTISGAYAAGELTQSLCSPWMHDFRDCACYYWASNHPDIVLGEDLPGEPTLPDAQSADPERANTPIDWLRADRSRARTAPAEANDSANRAAEMDHYEINKRWQDLSIVLIGKENSGVFQPRPIELKTPLADPDTLAQKLTELARLEHTLALEYLYARYSVLNPDRTNDATLKQDLIFVSHELLMIAVSEMRHLRWANQLIWELDHLQLTSKRFEPSLDLATQIPAQNGTRNRELRPLTKDVLDDFIAAEQPSGSLDGQYAAVLTTLRDKTKYPEELAQLAARIVADGTQHFSRFRQIRVVLQPHFDQQPVPYLVDLKPAPATNKIAQQALGQYKSILQELRDAYEKGDAEDFAHIATARSLMFALDAAAGKLADKGLGVPFF